jgi:DNA polymerase
MKSLPELCTEIRNCKKCDLQFSRKWPVCGIGGSQSSIMIVGEAPGAKEDEMGKPFVGRSGKLLDEILTSAKIQKVKVYLTNSVRCRPKVGESPKISEIRACSPYLAAEIESIKPRLIVPMGNSALNAIGEILRNSFGKVTEVSGTIYYCRKSFIVPQFHPAAILRNPKKKVKFAENFEKIAHLSQDLEIDPLDDIIKKYDVKIIQ